MEAKRAGSLVGHRIHADNSIRGRTSLDMEGGVRL